MKIAVDMERKYESSDIDMVKLIHFKKRSSMICMVTEDINNICRKTKNSNTETKDNV